MMQIAPLFPLAPASNTSQSHGATSQGGDSLFAGIFGTLRANPAQTAPQPGTKGQTETSPPPHHLAAPQSDLQEIAEPDGEIPSSAQEDDMTGAGQSWETFPFHLGFSSLVAHDLAEDAARSVDATFSNLSTSAGASMDQFISLDNGSVPPENSVISPPLQTEGTLPTVLPVSADTSVAEGTAPSLPSAASTTLSSEAFNGIPTPRAYPGVPQHAFFAFSESGASPLPGTTESGMTPHSTDALPGIPASGPADAFGLTESQSSRYSAAPMSTGTQQENDRPADAIRPTVPGRQFSAFNETTAMNEAGTARPAQGNEHSGPSTSTLAINMNPGQNSPQVHLAGRPAQPIDSTGQHSAPPPVAKPETPYNVTVTLAAAPQPDQDKGQFRRTTIDNVPGRSVANPLSVAGQPAEDGIDAPPAHAVSDIRKQLPPVIAGEQAAAKEKSSGSLVASISHLTDLKPGESRQPDRSFTASLRENVAADTIRDPLSAEPKGNADNQNSQNSFLGTKNQQGAGQPPTVPSATPGNSPAESFGAVEQLNSAPGQTPQPTTLTPGSLPSSQQPTSPFFQHMDNGVLHQLTDRFQLQMRNQETRLKLQLQPAELGKLDISLTVKEGAVRAHVVAQSGQTQEILERNMHRLRAIFENQGFTIEDILVSARSQVEPDNDFHHDQQSRKGAGNGMSRQNYDTSPTGSFEDIISSDI